MFFYLEKGARVLEGDEKMIRNPIFSIIPLILIQSSVWARPNVVFVMTDDQGYGEMSVHGNPILNTPYMDRLHGQSIRLSDYHAAPMCTPSRGQLLTGLDAARNGSINVSSGRTLLRAELPTMANFFQDAGYKTGIFGKWHLGDNFPFRPEDRGFDETLWFPSSHINSAADWWDNDYFDDTFMVNGERKQVPGFCTDAFFREAMTWIKRQADSGNPFFAYIPTNAPHSPFWAPEKELKKAREAMEGHELPNFSGVRREDLAGYFAMILNIDQNLGRLMRFLEEEGLAENTILIFQTDNGTTFGDRYYPAGMRGRKAQLWEGGHRVPFFLRWPGGNLGDPRDVGGLTTIQDILPTLLDLCEIQAQQNPDFDGVNLAPVFRGQQSAPPEDRMLVINYSRLPFGFEYPSPDAPSNLYREGGLVLWKRWRMLQDRELYNLDKDPLQQDNVIDQYPEVAVKMRAHLDAWWDDVNDMANEPQAVIIGSDRENPMMLSACDWLDVFVDQQVQVRRGVGKNSYWMLEVAEAGEYDFELRRWPRELDAPFTEGLPAMPGNKARWGVPGFAMPVGEVRIQLGREVQRKSVNPDDTHATFTFQLEKGAIRLHTWLERAYRDPLSGSFFVYITRK